MKLYATLSSEKGKSVSKCANDYIKFYISSSYSKYAELWIHAGDGYIELFNGKGDKVYSANACEFSRD
jgi:hypothetical protein